MKKIIFISILISFLSCKKADNKPIDDNFLQKLHLKGYVPQTIEKVEMPKYKIMEEKDISFRTGSNMSDPINKRFTYRVLVSPEIKRNQIEQLFNEIIKDITTKDGDIDDITIWLFSNKNLVHGVYDIAMATWEPSDGNVTSDIAVNNNRDSYKLNVTIPDKLEEYLNNKSVKSVKFGLSEDERKQISIEIGDSEDRAKKDTDKIYPNVNASNANKYADKLDELQEKYKTEIIKKHKITEDIYFSIMEEGVKKRWE